MVLDNYMANDIVVQYMGEAYVNTFANSYTIVFAVTNVQLNNACRGSNDPYETESPAPTVVVSRRWRRVTLRVVFKHVLNVTK